MKKDSTFRKVMETKNELKETQKAMIDSNWQNSPSIIENILTQSIVCQTTCSGED